MNLKSSKTILTIMNVLFWIVFIGLLVETGTLLFSYVASLFISETATFKLYKAIDLSELQNKDVIQYHIIMISYIIMSGLKAFIAYKVVKLFGILKLEKPFTQETTKFVFDISSWVFVTGIFGAIINSNVRWVSKTIQEINIEWNVSEILFFAGLIYIIAVIMQRGTEIQDENDLTV
ncbi:DUF2975 domain-containing protein [Flavobacterium okayamense]|uniref:DUF2975 domain-containing protein n=1 Tax=Flavobacterium okayamense TaxID=2830782 RepID=A0ABN6HVY8_9FLAO|nr:DUF2975 domain-containing protein [Flavobacterium okayamense]BCY28614.1 hypothetical protein KK2020170_14820 [Flavobacterium okayamense]